MDPTRRARWQRAAATALAVLSALTACRSEPARLRVLLAEPLDARAPYHSALAADGGSARAAGSITLTLNVYEGLVGFAGDRRPVPALAVSWRNPDELTWIFDLRRDVRFHDGSLLTAPDVVASLDRARQGGFALSTHLNTIADVSAPDPYTVRVRTLQRHPLLLAQLSIVPVASARDIAAGNARPNGTGPFRDAGEAAGGSRRLEAFEAYWGEPAPWAEVTVATERDAAARLERLVRGETDFAERLDPPELAELGRRPGLSVLTGAARDTLVLGLRVAPANDNAFADPRVREAVDVALDRRKLVASGGREQPASQLVPPAVFGRIAGLPLVEQDLPRARAALASAGRATPLAVPLLHAVEHRALAERVAADLAAAGLELRLEELTAEALPTALAERRPPAFLTRVRALSADGSDVLVNYFHSPDPAGRRGLLNWTGYADPQLDALVERARQELDWGERAAQLGRALTVAAQARALLPLVTRHDAHGARAGLAFRAEPRGFLRFADLTPAPR